MYNVEFFTVYNKLHVQYNIVVKMAWLQIMALPLASHVTLKKLLNLSVP